MPFTYIIDADKPFNGCVQNVILPTGIVAYSGGMNYDDYCKDHAGRNFRIISESELDAMTTAHEAGRVTMPAAIDYEKFDYALNVLPPGRWHSHRGVNMFHVIEHISGRLVDWYASLNGCYYHCVDFDNATSESLAAKFAAASNGSATNAAI